MVNVTNLTRRYHTRRGIENINLVLNEGEIIGLLGPNGCGKTTLIKLIMGLLQLDEGEIRIGAFHPNEAYSMVSYLPEQTYLGVWMTMDEAFSIFSSFYQDFNRQKAEQMLADFRLELKQPLKTMSKGMQEKAHLTLVMSRDVPFYILDEPMSGIDPASRESILEGILRNYNPGSTLLISTHLVSDVEMLFDRVIFMDEGTIRLDRQVEELRSEEGKSVDGYFRQFFGSLKGESYVR